MRHLSLHRLLASFALLLFITAGSVRAQADGQDPKKEAPEAIELHLLEKNAGAGFGDWVVWRYDVGDKAIFVINQKTGLVIYVPWTSNGWVNYGPGGGEWHVMFSKGEPEKQNLDDLKVAQFVGKRPATVLENGKFKFAVPTKENDKDVTHQWTVKVTKDYIDFHCASYDDRMTIRRTSGEVVHNGRSIGKE